MGVVNSEHRHLFRVVDTLGAVVTGLVTGDFTITLQYNSAGSLVPSLDTVTVGEISGGNYWATFTPTVTGVHELDITHASHVVAPSHFEDVVTAGYASATGGPYLTTRDNVKTALDLTNDTQYDAAIDALLAAVTDYAETMRGGSFFEVSQVDLLRGAGSVRIVLPRWPITTLSSLHVSTDIPRVWDATTLLDVDTEYLFDASTGIVERIDGGLFPDAPQSVRVDSLAGYSTIPADLERAAIETIAVKLFKGTGILYHLQADTRAEGSIAGVRLDDIPPATREVFRRYAARGF